MKEIPQGAVWVRLPRFIGDAVMMGRELEPLRIQGVPLIAWGPDPVADLFAGSSWFDAAFGDGPGKPGALAMAKVLKAHRPRALVNLSRSARGLVAGVLAGVPERFGWSEGGGRWLCTRHRRFALPGHQGDRYQDLLRAGFGDFESMAPRPFRPGEDALLEAARLRAQEGIGNRYAVIGLGAAAWIKRLGTPVWARLVPQLKAGGLQPVLLGGTFHEDLAQARELKELFPTVPDLCGRTSLPVSAALVTEARLTIANESALAHLAAASGTPVVTAFGPTEPARTEPRGPRARIVRCEDLDCLGCLSFECRRGDHACMQALPAEQVWAVCRELLETPA